MLTSPRLEYAPVLSDGEESMSTTVFRSPGWKSATLTNQASEVRRSVWHELEPLRQTLSDPKFSTGNRAKPKASAKKAAAKRSTGAKRKKKITP
jgi:hypothetical protein